MPKTVKQNPFMCFVEECKRKESINKPLPQIINQVASRWQSMTEAQKEPYRQMSSNLKKPNQNDNASQSMDQAKNNPSQDRADSPLMIQNYNLRTFFQTVLENKSELITSHNWYFIQFSSFCRTSSSETCGYSKRFEPYFVLGEVALVEYNLSNGIQREYHSFIKPNKIPQGFSSECRENSKKTHQIPLEGIKPSKPYGLIYKEILKFVNGLTGSTFGLFCRESELELTKFGLDFLRDQFEFEKTEEERKNSVDFANSLDVYSLELLLMKLGEADKYSVMKILNNECYKYTEKIKCKYHEDKQICECSLGFVKCYAYLTSDSVCSLFNIKLTGKHVPIITKRSNEKDDDYRSEKKRKN